MAICSIVSITATANTIALWLKHIKQGSLLVQQKSSKLCFDFESGSTIHLWNNAQIFILVFSLVESNSFFLHCFFCQYCFFFPLTWAMMGYFTSLLLLSVLCHCLQFQLECIWPGKSRHYACTGEGHCEGLTLLRHSRWLWMIFSERENEHRSGVSNSF